MENQKVLFICPHLDYDNPWEFSFKTHLGASYIRSFLKEKGISSAQFIQYQPIDLSTLAERVLNQRPKIVGITCYDVTYHFVKCIAKKLKNESPETLVIVGGPSATFSDELILKDCPAIDLLVRGEGEYATYELIEVLKKNLNFGSIGGITYRQNGKIIRNPDRPLIKGSIKGAELDILPSPYLNGTIQLKEAVGLVTARGCVYHCAYCNFSAISRWTIRYHSVERVISELKKLSGNIEHVSIWDDTFTLNIERAKHICRRILEENIKLNYWCQTRGDRVDEELLRLLHQVGFKSMAFGLESAVPKILRTVKKVRAIGGIGKDLKPERDYIRKMGKSIKLAKEIGLDPEVNVMIGCPGASVKDDQKTMDFVKKLKVNRYIHHPLNILPGTELFLTYKQYGLKVKSSPMILPYNTYHAYDTSKIKEMKTSYRGMVRSRRTEQVEHLLTGFYEVSPREGHPDILFEYCSPLDDRTLRWLKELIPFSPRLGFICRHSRDRIIQKNLKRMIESGLPIVCCFSLKPDQRNNYQVYFHEAGSQPHLMDSFQGTQHLIDSCRWFTQDCPAIKLSRLIIKKDGSLSPCFKGKKVGKIGDKRMRIIHRLVTLQEKIKKERGCNNCLAKENCPKCLFPDTRNIEEYCFFFKNQAKKNSYETPLLFCDLKEKD